MLFFETSPEVVHGSPNRSVIQGNKPLTSQNYKVQTRQICLMPEAFSDLAFYPVSLDSKLQVLLGEDQTDPGVTKVVWCRQDQEIPMRNLQLYVVEDFAVISRSQKTM